MLRSRLVERNTFAQFIRGQRAAEVRSLQLIREEGPRSSEEAFARAMELCDLAPVGAHDPLRERDDLQARQMWAKVRAWAAGRAPGG